MSMQGYWADHKAPDFRDLAEDVIAVLPIGATEQHGPHLPVSVDSDLVTAVIERTLPRLHSKQNVLILPDLTVTKSDEHDRHPGTLSLSADTLLAVLRDIGASVARSGVKRLVLFNGHGGNTAVLETAARDLRISHELIVATCSWFGFSEWDSVLDPDAASVDLHAGESETSSMLAARPQLVDMSRAQNFVPAIRAWEEHFSHIGLTGQTARPGWIIDDLHADGACGDATAATAEKGERLLNTAASNFAQFLAEFARFDHRSGAT